MFFRAMRNSFTCHDCKRNRYYLLGSERSARKYAKVVANHRVAAGMSKAAV